MTSQFISARFVEESSAATFDFVSAHVRARREARRESA
jgi:hypothetical protein